MSSSVCVLGPELTGSDWWQNRWVSLNSGYRGGNDEEGGDDSPLLGYWCCHQGWYGRENLSTAEGPFHSWTPPLNISVPWWPHELCRRAELLLLLISLWKSLMFKEGEAKTWSSSEHLNVPSLCDRLTAGCSSCFHTRLLYKWCIPVMLWLYRLTSSWLCICLHVAVVTVSHSPPSSSVRTREWARPQATCSTLVCWGWTRGRATGDGSNTKS